MNKILNYFKNYFEKSSKLKILGDGVFYLLIIAFLIPSTRTLLIRASLFRPKIESGNVVPTLKTEEYQLILEDMEGKRVNLADFSEQPLFISFWATWCPPCRKGIPDLVELKKKYGKKGFEVVGISLDGPQTKGDVVPFIKDYGINYPVVYGNEAVTINYGGVQSIPTAFVIDKQGKIVASYVGLRGIEVYEEQIKKLL